MNFSLVQTTPTSGYIIGNNQHNLTSIQSNSNITLGIPDGYVVMTSFAQIQTHNMRDNSNCLIFPDQNKADIPFRRRPLQRYSESNVYSLTSITVQWVTHRYCWDPTSFTLLYTFHPEGKVPHRLSSGLYNCSVDHYWTFQQHLHCNIKVECEDGRDETADCPVSSAACRPWGNSGRKCYRLVTKESLQSSDTGYRSFLARAVRFCASLNASIGVPKDVHDLKIMRSIFAKIKTRRGMKIILGLSYGGSSAARLYRRSLVGVDNSVLHYSLNSRMRYMQYSGKKMCIVLLDHTHLLFPSCSDLENSRHYFSATCAFITNDNGAFLEGTKAITLPNISFAFNGQNRFLTVCPDGQITHTFLSDRPHNAWPEHTASPGRSVDLNDEDSVRRTDEHLMTGAVFTCDDDTARLSYTLVCDFRHDCQDGRDETFCQHPPCDAFTCNNGQCVSFVKRCDSVPDCVDNSDETKCRIHRTVNLHLLNFQSPALIQFDGVRFFTTTKMKSTDKCPDTHYHCPGEYNDCLPVFTHCNGWYDCIGREDEEGCADMTCPGFYRCLNSTVCVHAAHVCDGWPHCPQRDDEWLCGMVCPAQCLCRGYVFLCHKPFSAYLFPQLRYLDARESDMTLSVLTDNPYLISLILSRCSLTLLPAISLHNLQFLDLSSNHLRVINISVLAGFTNMRTLIVAENPILFLYSEGDMSPQQNVLKTMDLSLTNLTVFDSKPLAPFGFLHTLNLSYSPIHTVNTSGFRYTPRLTRLYMEGVPVQTFPADMLSDLSRLRTVTADTYKMCCKQILPSQSDLIFCDAPSDEISSCEDLLQSGTYRIFLWMIGCLSLLGNTFCLIARACLQRSTSNAGFHVFVTNLSMADLLMGVYIAVIGVADELFRGKYLFVDLKWTHSMACKVAGFLSLLSCEVSALVIWLITLDRFVVLHFPFSSAHFQRTSAAAVCLMMWTIGMLLASVPLLPATSHWEFFSQTGICIPLPVTRADFKGKTYSIGVLIVLNFVLFLLIAMGQACIYWSVQKNALRSDSTNTSRDLTIARRLISVAVTDFLCWFPIGLCGLLALAEIPIPGEVNVALAIFVLPLNSALNPFMYTFNMLMEKRRKSREATLLRWLELHIDLLDKA